jgi:hypothetical protein
MSRATRRMMWARERAKEMRRLKARLSATPYSMAVVRAVIYEMGALRMRARITAIHLSRFNRTYGRAMLTGRAP